MDAEDRPDSEPLRRLRTEAEQLMGLDEMPMPEFEPEEQTAQSQRDAQD